MSLFPVPVMHVGKFTRYGLTPQWLTMVVALVWSVTAVKVIAHIIVIIIIYGTHMTHIIKVTFIIMVHVTHVFLMIISQHAMGG